MFYINFCVKCNWNFGGFLKIHNIFYKHILNINYENNVQQNYLSIINRAIMELFSCIFRRENRTFINFFSNSKFGIRVYRGKVETRNGYYFVYILRIYPRKINILKKTKLGPIEPNEVDDMNIYIYINSVQFNEYF